jgi:hypothetical protein
MIWKGSDGYVERYNGANIKVNHSNPTVIVNVHLVRHIRRVVAKQIEIFQNRTTKVKVYHTEKDTPTGFFALNSTSDDDIIL